MTDLQSNYNKNSYLCTTMKTRRRVVLVFITLLLSLSVWAQRSAYFVVNGQSCEEGYCSLNVFNLGVGRPLQLRLAGSYRSGDLEFFLTFNGKKKSLQGVTLEFRGYSVSIGADRLRIPSSQVSQLFGSGLPLRLHLGELSASTSGVVSVHARRVGTTEDMASLDINLEGLRIPGEEIPWAKNFGTPPHSIAVPIYPNPVRQGPIFVDLQTFPNGTTGTVSVVDLLGTRLYRAAVAGGSVHQFSSELFPKGVYFVRIEMEGDVVYTARLVVEK